MNPDADAGPDFDAHADPGPDPGPGTDADPGRGTAPGLGARSPRSESDEVSVSIVEHPIDPAEVLQAVGGPEDGAVLLFLGNVRNRNEGREVTGIRYEGYAEMAGPLLREIAGEANIRWGIERVALVHRLGHLDVGETSIAVALSTGHRAEAYEASRYIMEEVKKRLPVWKHEAYADGDAGWVAGRDAGPES